MTEYDSYVQRVRQVDAVQLDTHLLEVLKLQASKVTKAVRPGVVERFQPEIDLLIGFLIWKFSVWEKRATYGQQLLSLRYGQSMTQRKAIVWAVLTLAPKYFKDRYLDVKRVFSHGGFSDQMWRFLDWAETGVQLMSFVNCLVFLVRGSYPTLVDRLLAQKVESTRRELHVGYQFLTRELMWHTLVDVFTLVLPLVNYHYVRRKLSSVFGKRGRVDQPASKLAVVFNPTTKCPVCGDSPVTPSHMGCAHIFCYYCLQANYLADAGFQCPLCGHMAKDGSSIQQFIQEQL